MGLLDKLKDMVLPASDEQALDDEQIADEAEQIDDDTPYNHTPEWSHEKSSRESYGQRVSGKVRNRTARSTRASVEDYQSPNASRARIDANNSSHSGNGSNSSVGSTARRRYGTSFDDGFAASTTARSAATTNNLGNSSNLGNSNNTTNVSQSRQSGTQNAIQSTIGSAKSSDLELQPATSFGVSESVSLVSMADVRALQNKLSAKNSTGQNNIDPNTTAEFDPIVGLEPLVSDGSPRRVQILAPRRFNDMEALCTALKANKIAVLKIGRLPHELAVRLLDFGFGACAALGGHIVRNKEDEFIFHLGSAPSEAEEIALKEKGIFLRQ